MSLVECVPNFSEGRRAEVIQKIAAAIRAVGGVQIINISSDADHNRTVMTFIGEPEPVFEGAFHGIRAAAALIDLETHRGVHPRIGATDVVPFIPLREVSIEACATLARRLGERVGSVIGLPVYLYEKAAVRDDRVNLADIRRGGYEMLKTAIQEDVTRMPDYGPNVMGPAGAVAIGARGPLIAFNIFLNTENVDIAKAIARAVRESGGGLPYLKALGLVVDGQAQVSMNVIDYRKTGLYTIYQAVHTQAKLHGVTITHTELVGLLPQEALIDAGLTALQLPAAVRELILERLVGQYTGDYREIPFE